MSVMGEAFSANVISTPESWDFRIDTNPVKFITILPSFVAEHIDNDTMNPAEFLEIISTSDRRHWAALKDGAINLVLK